MIEPFLRSQLEPVARRRRLWTLSRDLTLCWATAAMLGVLFVVAYRLSGWISTSVLPLLGVATFVASIWIWIRHRRSLPDFRQIARQIEQTHPELHALLLTAVEQQPDAATGKFNFLQERLIREAILESMDRDWRDTVSQRQLLGMQLAQVAGFVLLLAALTGLRVQTKEGVALAKPAEINVTPGDTAIERGNALAVLARFAGPLPAEVTLVIRPDSQPERRVSLVKSLNDPIFGGTIPEITNRLSYHVVFDDGRTRDFKVDVFEYPRLERADAHLIFPEYTGLTEKTIQDTRRVSAVEGSTLNLSLQLNKPVASARLIARDKTVLPLMAATNQANAALHQFPLKSSQVYDLVLVDTSGRTNKIPTQILVDVLTNRGPEIRFNYPRGDQRVSPLEEIGFSGEVWDDFGIKEYGITFSLAGAKPQSISLGTAAPSREKRQFAHLLGLENLAAEPDQLLSYFIWADDTGPDGQLRRSASDMYYAEVRPFEEIFREGQSAPENESEQQEGQGNELTKLSELQKQIINATWRLQRENQVGLDAEPSTSPKRPPTGNYTKDVAVVEKSQEEALEQAAEKKEQSQTTRTKALWDTVEKEMSKAADELGSAKKSPESLASALAAEQAAYQALLKLASREKQVVQNRRGGGGGGGQQNQRQLDQLDLKQSENRYESQRQAAANKQNPEQREQLQIQNRLKELAQRQHDLNERLKELQTALQEAKSEEEREEIRRRLKRLREEEQQMLADTDELLQRMDRPENQSRMADARQQLEQARNQVQRASEMIEKEAVGQALSSGTRAQREFQDLREDLRKKNSAQFAEEMRQMRSDARELAQKEEQIGEKLKSITEAQRKTLSDSGQTKTLLDQMGQQKEKMTNLLDQMARVSQDAEASEPLLAKQLYDTLRQAKQGNIDDSLQKASELLQLSFINEAGQFEQRARKEIDDMKQGVERAAESVLGDETEALRLARRELDDLARQVEKEMAQAESASKSQNSPNQQGDGQRSAAGSQTGQPGKTPDQSTQGTANAQNPDEQQSRNGQIARSQQGEGGQNGQPQPGQENSQATNEDRAQAQNGSPGGTQPSPTQMSQAESNSPGQGAGQGSGQASTQQQQQAQSESETRPNRPRQRPSLSAQGQGQGQQGRPGQRGENTGAARGNGTQAAGGGGGEGGERMGGPGPLTGEGYADWSDRLRDVEEMLDEPELRNEVAGVRERARTMRMEFKKLSKPPQWDVVRGQIAEPLAEVRNRISEELARRESKDSLVPIDRDPVPQKFTELVRRYYEKLGSSESDSSGPQK